VQQTPSETALSSDRDGMQSRRTASGHGNPIEQEDWQK
jgi:hypothetical protein